MMDAATPLAAVLIGAVHLPDLRRSTFGRRLKRAMGRLFHQSDDDWPPSGGTPADGGRVMMDQSKSCESEPPMRLTGTPATQQRANHQRPLERRGGAYTGLTKEQLAVWHLLAAEPAGRA